MNIVTSLVMSLCLLSGTIKGGARDPTPERARGSGGTGRAEESEPKGTWGDMQGNRNFYLARLHSYAWLTCNRTTYRPYSTVCLHIHRNCLGVI